MSLNWHLSYEYGLTTKNLLPMALTTQRCAWSWPDGGCPNGHNQPSPVLGLDLGLHTPRNCSLNQGSMIIKILREEHPHIHHACPMYREIKIYSRPVTTYRFHVLFIIEVIVYTVLVYFLTSHSDYYSLNWSQLSGNKEFDRQDQDIFYRYRKDDKSLCDVLAQELRWRLYNPHSPSHRPTPNSGSPCFPKIVNLYLFGITYFSGWSTIEDRK